MIIINPLTEVFFPGRSALIINWKIVKHYLESLIRKHAFTHKENTSHTRLINFKPQNNVNAFSLSHW